MKICFEEKINTTAHLNPFLKTKNAKRSKKKAPVYGSYGATVRQNVFERTMRVNLQVGRVFSVYFRWWTDFTSHFCRTDRIDLVGNYSIDGVEDAFERPPYCYILSRKKISLLFLSCKKPSTD